MNEEKGNEKGPGMSPSREERPGLTGDSACEKLQETVSPFAKAYNDYFRTVYEMQRALQRRIWNAYQTYSKAVQDAMDARSCDALREAGEKLRAELREAMNPAEMMNRLRQAFETYQREVKAAFAAAEAGPFDQMSIALIAQSMGGVAFHRMVYGGV